MNRYNDIKTWHKDKTLERVSENLRKREFNSLILNTINDIRDYILKEIPQSAKVGIGGSVSVRETGVDSMLKERGNVVYDHWDSTIKTEDMLEVRKKAQTSDYYLTGVNALTINGQIVNIDGAGNRVSSMIFGPGHVIAIAGFNKIAKDTEEALRRIKNIATPQNSKRLGLDTPCAEKGYCLECRAPKTICRITTIIDFKPMLTDFTVILTGLDLGY